MELCCKMLVKGLYYVKLKMSRQLKKFGQISGDRCNEHYQIFAGICVRFRFGRKAPFGNNFFSVSDPVPSFQNFRVLTAA